LDQSIISRLVNIKTIYDHSLRLLENPTPLEGAIALVLMDNSLEAMLKLVLDEIKESSRKDPNFPMLLENVLQTEKLKDLKSYKVSLMGLHAARNGFQHQGIIPDINSVTSQYKPLAETFLQTISQQKLGIDWASVSLSLLIRNEEIAGLIKKSERAFAICDYVTAAAYLIYAFESTKALAKLYIFGSGLSSAREGVKKYRKNEPLVRYITTLDEEIETFKLGLNYKDFRYYLDVAQIAGLTSVLDELPSAKEEEAITEIIQKLRSVSILTDALLKEWCICVNDFILRFILRTESNPRITVTLIQEFMKGVAEGLSKLSKNSKSN